MNRCSERNSAIGRIAASTAPAAKTLQFFDCAFETNWKSPTDERLLVGIDQDHRGDHELAERGDEGEQADDGEDRRDQAQDDREEDARVPGAVDLRGLVDRRGHGVEEPVHEVRVHAERAAQVDHDQADERVQPERGEHVADRRHQQEDRDEGEQLREHLHQQEREQAEPPPRESHPRERIRGEGAQEHGARRRRRGRR